MCYSVGKLNHFCKFRIIEQIMFSNQIIKRFFFSLSAEPKLYDEIGRERYLHMCRILFINPCLRFLKLLGTTEIDLSVRISKLLQRYLIIFLQLKIFPLY